jgi:hypothetical protein
MFSILLLFITVSFLVSSVISVEQMFDLVQEESGATKISLAAKAKQAPGKQVKSTQPPAAKGGKSGAKAKKGVPGVPKVKKVKVKSKAKKQKNGPTPKQVRTK